eukprot:197876-Chlamydomonas_euryale.AAC.1
MGGSTGKGADKRTSRRAGQHTKYCVNQRGSNADTKGPRGPAAPCNLEKRRPPASANSEDTLA